MGQGTGLAKGSSQRDNVLCNLLNEKYKFFDITQLLDFENSTRISKFGISKNRQELECIKCTFKNVSKGKYGNSTLTFTPRSGDPYPDWPRVS